MTKQRSKKIKDLKIKDLKIKDLKIKGDDEAKTATPLHGMLWPSLCCHAQPRF